MTYVTLLFLVVASALVVAVATVLVQRFLALDIRRQHHEIGNPVYLQIGVMFAVLLAFVFSEVWSEYNIAGQAINGECGALHGAAMLAHDLPDQAGIPIERAIVAYATTVINVEWPALQQRHASPEAVSDFEKVIDAAAHLNLTRPGDLSVQGQILSLITQAHAFRETRVFQANQGLSAFIWLVLIVYTIVLTAFVLFAGVESRIGHMIFSGVSAASVIIVLALVRMLDYPFEGPMTLSYSDFATMMQRVVQLIG
jgi:hypothetical protein